MADPILYFASNTDTMLATKVLRDAGVTARMLPTPANVSTAANLCLSVTVSSESTALAALKSVSVALSGVVRN